MRNTLSNTLSNTPQTTNYYEAPGVVIRTGGFLVGN